jgi:UDP-N-acetylglucosamine 1-carboxyvinyltransferase
MAASLLLPIGRSLTLANMPRISDVATMGEILNVYGIAASWSGPSTLVLSRERYLASPPVVPVELATRIRGSIVLLGALATQYRSFPLVKPGGDSIGGRPITAHITALEDLGFGVSDEPGLLRIHRKTHDIRGGTVVLTEQSVTATLMLLLYSACLGPGQHLTIADAACEPHVITLCGLLESLGARIDGIASNLLTIAWPCGVSDTDTSAILDGDFMEAATYAIAAAVTRSDVDIPFSNAALTLHIIDRYLGWMGVRTELAAHRWRIFGSRSDLCIRQGLSVIKAEPWPRFPTDVMSMFVVLATQCTGTMKFVEYMYDDRFGFVQALRDMGALIDVQPPHAITVRGPTGLKSNEMFLRPDIRSGASMLLAALAGNGETVLHDHRNVIERGYQDLPQTLAALGARITEATAGLPNSV